MSKMSDAIQPGKSPLEYLAEAERRFAARSNRDGSRRVWQAFLAAAAPLAAQRGLPCGNLDEFREVMQALGQENGDAREMRYVASLAEGFLNNSMEVGEGGNFDLELYHWPDEEFPWHRKRAKRDLDYLLSISKAPKGVKSL